MQSLSPDLQCFIARVERLEKQNRLFKHGGLLLLLLAASLIVMGQARPSRTLEAQSFVLTDAGGIRRAELATLNAGPILRFFDSSGKVKATLSATGYTIFGTGTRTVPSDKGPVQIPIDRLWIDLGGLHVADERGRAIINLGGFESPQTTASPSPLLQLFDSNEKVRVELSGKSDVAGVSVKEPDGRAEVSLEALPQGPGIAVSDTKGKLRASIAALQDGPSILLWDKNGNAGVVLHLTQDGPRMSLTDKNGNAGVDFQLTQDGPRMSLTDAQGFSATMGITDLVTPRTGERHKTSAASFVLLGKDGKVLWSAP